MRLSEVMAVLEKIAPLRYAQKWDNVGLLVGDPGQTISRAMLTIDLTPDVLQEAIQHRCDLVIAYHPPIFQPMKRVLAADQNVIFDSVRADVAIYSPHTAIDVADGGTSDALADVLEMKDRAPLRVLESAVTRYKLVTFVPEKDLEKVSAALFAAGAGRIGEYHSCSFRTPGTGTFFGKPGTNPAVGESGRLEHAAEIKVETIVEISDVSAVVEALRESHSYEEPAFDLQQLAAPPEGVGMGRVGAIEPTSRSVIFDRIKRELKLNHLLIAGATDGEVNRAAVCPGSCGEFLDDAIAQKVDLFLTGELRHHDALKAATHGITVVCTLHSNSERLVLRRIADRLGEDLPELDLAISQSDRDPFSIH